METLIPVETRLRRHDLPQNQRDKKLKRIWKGVKFRLDLPLAVAGNGDVRVPGGIGAVALHGKAIGTRAPAGNEGVPALGEGRMPSFPALVPGALLVQQRRRVGVRLLPVQIASGELLQRLPERNVRSQVSIRMRIPRAAVVISVLEPGSWYRGARFKLPR